MIRYGYRPTLASNAARGYAECEGNSQLHGRGTGLGEPSEHKEMQYLGDTMSALGSSPRYRLLPHVYVCARDDYVVLLDSERGKYVAIDGRHACALTEFIYGWPDPPRHLRLLHAAVLPSGTHGAAGQATVNRMLSEGLLTLDQQVGKPATPCLSITTVTFQIFSLETSFWMYLAHLPTFLFACARAQHLQDSLSLASLGNRIKERKQRWSNRGIDEEKLKALVRAHHHLRPLVYTVRDACRYDSLVLLEFLSLYGIGATWVFGVHTWPWIPHCWVRSGSLLLNDTPDNIGRYSVIAEF